MQTDALIKSMQSGKMNLFLLRRTNETVTSAIIDLLLPSQVWLPFDHQITNFFAKNCVCKHYSTTTACNAAARHKCQSFYRQKKYKVSLDSMLWLCQKFDNRFSVGQFFTFKIANDKITDH